MLIAPAAETQCWLVDIVDATDVPLCGGKAAGLARLEQAGWAVPAAIRGHTDRGGNGPAGLLQPRQTSCLTSAQWHVRRVDDVDQPALRLGRGGNQHGPMLVATRGRLYGTLVSAPVEASAR